jgi:hypothetical protein
MKVGDIVTDLRLLQQGKLHEVYKINEDSIITTTGILLYDGQYAEENDNWGVDEDDSYDYLSDVLNPKD